MLDDNFLFLARSSGLVVVARSTFARPVSAESLFSEREERESLCFFFFLFSSSILFVRLLFTVCLFSNFWLMEFFRAEIESSREELSCLCAAAAVAAESSAHNSLSLFLSAAFVFIYSGIQVPM